MQFDNRRARPRLRAWLLSLVVILPLVGSTEHANAQISFGPFVDENTVCAIGNSILIAVDDDCITGLTGITFSAPSTLAIGPGGVTNFNPTNGNATFGAFALFTAGTQLNGTTSFGTAPTFNSGFVVSGGQTVDMGGNRVQNVATPTAGTDAANKQYVDDRNAAQDTRITAVENVNTTQNTRLTSIETVNTDQQNQIDNLESTTVSLQSQIDSNSADILGLQSDVTGLKSRDRQFAEGIAISLALEAPLLRQGQTFAMRGGWGNFDGTQALGFTAAGALGQNVVVDAGVGWGTGRGTVAGKAGFTIGW